MTSALWCIVGAVCGGTAAALLLDWLAHRRDRELEITVHVNSYLDGQKLAEAVRRRLVRTERL